MASLRSALGGDDLVICLALSIARTPDVPAIAAAAGYDAVYVDLEHAATSWDTTALLCSAAIGAGIGSLVRVPSRAPDVIARALDVGAQGVIAPHVTSKADAEQVVAAARFPPHGERSVSGPNPVSGFGPMEVSDRLARIDAETVVMAMVESEAAVEVAPEIAGVPGIDMLLLGPHDLAAEVGVPGDLEHPAVREAMSTVASACRAAGIWFGVAGLRAADRIQALVADHGLRFATAGTDVGLFTDAAFARVAELRSSSGPITRDPRGPAR